MHKTGSLFRISFFAQWGKLYKLSRVRKREREREFQQKKISERKISTTDLSQLFFVFNFFREISRIPESPPEIGITFKFIFPGDETEAEKK